MSNVSIKKVDGLFCEDALMLSVKVVLIDVEVINIQKKVAELTVIKSL